MGDVNKKLWEGVDREVVDGMSANLNTYVEVLNCTCEGLCTCDDTEALAAAMEANTIDLTRR